MSTCPNCGHLNVEQATFCQSCGTRLYSAPFPRSPIAHQTQTSSYSGGTPITTIIIVIVIIGVVVSAISFGIFFLEAPQAISRAGGLGRVQITVLTLYIGYSSSSDNYFGSQYQFPVIGPIYRQHGQTYSFNAKLTLAANATTSHSVDSITLGFSDGFSIQSESPPIPFTITQPESSVALTITLLAPNYDYSGPVTIDLFTH